MNKMTKILALVLVLMMVLPVLAACKRPADGDTTPEPGATKDPQSENTEKPGEEGAEYTYNLTLGAGPTNWNPHTWEMNTDSEIMSYLEMPIVDAILAEDGINFKWVFEMVTDITDVTATYADREKWLEPDEKTGELPTENYIYEMKLNPDAKWEDGTPINADTYMWSMERLISSEMKNYRSNNYTRGDTALVNAYNYYYNNLAGTNQYAQLIKGIDEKTGEYIYNTACEEGTTEYGISLVENAAYFGGRTIQYYYEYNNGQYADLFIAEDGTDIYQYLNDLGAGDYYVAVDEKIEGYLKELVVNFEDPEDEWILLIGAKSGTWGDKVEFSDVGLQKVDDYTIVYINAEAVTPFYFYTACTSGWIVYKDLYEAGYKTTGKLTTTNYGTSVDTYMAYGPYKLQSFENDKQFVLVRNENWYGWTDGKHEGQYQTTKIVYDIIAEDATALMSFLQGKLDEVSLTSDDMATYRMSSNLLKTDQTYTYRFVFNSDPESLAKLENEAGDGANKRVLQYDDFRKAISLSIDRTAFCNQATSAHKPAYALLNSLYYYDVENDNESVYRRTDEAMSAVCRLYGIEYGEGKEYANVEEAYASVTGYDVEAARALFQAVAEQAIAEGQYTEGQAINITCEATGAQSLSADDQKQQELMNEFVAAATVGTPFEGKITFKFLAGAQDRYGDVATGKIEMIRGAWGGAAFYPFSTIRVYCNPGYMGGLEEIHESGGWDPSTDTLTIPINGEDVTRTFEEWSDAINDPKQYANDPDMCLHILSYLETGILSTYQCIPVSSDVVVSMFSNQIKYATLDYNIMYGYGGIRFMTYNYNDAEWADYVASQGGTIDYTE
ncbi:MAG: hypothetical protein J1E60_03380 [Christensenellaceae bacterium]|nr:hypothetical protein [Christensenellaceae bacterium]